MLFWQPFLDDFQELFKSFACKCVIYQNVQKGSQFLMVPIVFQSNNFNCSKQCSENDQFLYQFPLFGFLQITFDTYCKSLQTGQNIVIHILPFPKHYNMLYFSSHLPPKSMSENCQFWAKNAIFRHFWRFFGYFQALLSVENLNQNTTCCSVLDLVECEQ